MVLDSLDLNKSWLGACDYDLSHLFRHAYGYIHPMSRFYIKIFSGAPK